YWGSADGYSSGNKTELPTHRANDNSIADLNNDGYLDIVFSNSYNGATHNINSYIYWGSASGYRDSNKTELPTHCAEGNSIADLNNDGYLDIVFSGYSNGATSNINSYIYWGSASGYRDSNKTELPTIGAGDNLIADLNNDGYLDIVFSSISNGATWNTNSYIYWGSASGYSSGNKTELPTHGAYRASIADLNNNGYLDIVFSNNNNGATWNINSYIYWGSADGFSSGNKTELPTQGAGDNSIADLNNDGYLDIVFSNAYNGVTHNINSYIYWGSASGYSSGNKTELPTHHASGNSIGDLNNDGYLDIVFSNHHNDATYNLNSYIYWGSESGYSSANKAELPTHGAHGNSISGGDIISANTAYGTTTLSYFKSASITSEKIQPSLLGNWNKFYAKDTLPKGTNITYKILKASDNSTLCTITSAEANIGYDISKCANRGSAIRLYGELSTENNYATPILHDWRVSWQTPSELSALYIHAPGKQCINSPLYVQITDYNNIPIENAQVMFSLGTDFGPYTSDSKGYVSAFTPESTGTLTITAGSGNQTSTATVEVINSSLCGPSTCQKCPSSEAKGKVSIKNFNTDKNSYSTGKVIKMTATLENTGTCNYPIYANVNTLTPSGKPLFSMGYNVTVESGVNTLSFEAYVPGIAEKGTYNLNFFWKTEKSDLLPVGSKTIQVTIQ
ncbi:MAG: FG-GAP repeat domain-containing protein, partial [Methanosarcinales archaeon]